jgi:hypothetical protein
LTRTPKIAQLVAAALAGALLAGGGYALAASSTKTIHACANKTTHVLTLQKRCARNATSVTWNQRGPQGKTGPSGPAGQEPVAAFGSIGTGVSGAIVSGQNLAVTQAGPGTFEVTVTGGVCSGEFPTPVVSPIGPGTGSAALAFLTGPDGGNPFGITVGTFIDGTFTPQNGIPVHVAVYCKTS